MTIGITSANQVAAESRVKEIQKAKFMKTNDMPIDSVSFGNQDGQESQKPHVGVVAMIVGAAAIVGGAIWALRKGKTDDAKNVVEKGKEVGQAAAEKGKEAVKKKVKLPKSKVEIFSTSNGGKNKLITNYAADGKVSTRQTIFYDKDGNVTRITVKGGDTGWTPISSTNITRKGNLVLSETVSADGKTIKKVVKDANGNIKSKKYEKIGQDGQVVSETYVKKFDSAGNPLEKRVTTTVNGEKVSKSYVKNGKVWEEVVQAAPNKTYGEMTKMEALIKRATAIGKDGKPTADAMEARKLLNKIEAESKKGDIRARAIETRRFNKEHRIGKGNIYSAEESLNAILEAKAGAQKV